MPRHELIRSVLRSLDILDLVAQSEEGLSLKEICQILGYNDATAYNLIRTLVSRNYIERTPAPVRYRLGRGVVRLADVVTTQQFNRRAAAMLPRLYDEILAMLPRPLEPQDDLAVSFAQSIGGEIRLIMRVRSDRPGVLTRPMSLMNPYRSTSAQIYQAYWTREEANAYRSMYPFDDFGKAWWPSQKAFDRYLVTIRRENLASPDIYHPEECRLSVPVFGERQMLVGVLGVGVWMKQLNSLIRLRITRRMIDAGKELTFTPEPEPASPPKTQPPQSTTTTSRAKRRNGK